MRRFIPASLVFLVAACATAPAPEPKPEPEVKPEDTGLQPVVKASETDALGKRMVAEADRLFTEGSRSRTQGRADEAVDLLGRAIGIYEALAVLGAGENAPSREALTTRSANAKAERRKAQDEALVAARGAWKTEFEGTLPAAPFPVYAEIVKHFQDAVARNPEDRASRRRLAGLLLADERYPEAAALLDGAADAEPVFDLARAALWYRLGRNEDAEKKLEGIRLAWRKALPARIERASFCLAPPKGFDRFTAASGTSFFAQQSLWVYFEVVNATCAPVGDGTWHVSLKCDYEVVDEAGKVVPWPEVKDFTRDYDPAPYGTVVNDVCLMLGLKLPQAPRGKYTLVLKLTDKIEGKTAEARMPFELK